MPARPQVIRHRRVTTSQCLPWFGEPIFWARKAVERPNLCCGSPRQELAFGLTWLTDLGAGGR